MSKFTTSSKSLQKCLFQCRVVRLDVDNCPMLLSSLAQHHKVKLCPAAIPGGQGDSLSAVTVRAVLQQGERFRGEGPSVTPPSPRRGLHQSLQHHWLAANWQIHCGQDERQPGMCSRSNCLFYSKLLHLLPIDYTRSDLSRKTPIDSPIAPLQTVHTITRLLPLALPWNLKVTVLWTADIHGIRACLAEVPSVPFHEPPWQRAHLCPQ